MSEHDAEADDRAARFSAAATPEERAAVLGLDYGELKRSARRALGLYVSVVGALTIAVMVIVTLTEASLLVVLLGFASSIAVGLVPPGLTAAMTRGRAGASQVFLAANVGGALWWVLLALAVAFLPPPAGYIAGIFAIIGAGSALNLLAPRGLATLIRRSNASAIDAADLLPTYPKWVAGVPPSTGPAVAFLIDIPGIVAAVVVIAHDAAWAVPVILLGVLSGAVWSLAVRRDRPALAFGSSITQTVALVAAALFVT